MKSKRSASRKAGTSNRRPTNSLRWCRSPPSNWERVELWFARREGDCTFRLSRPGWWTRPEPATVSMRVFWPAISRAVPLRTRRGRELPPGLVRWARWAARAVLNEYEHDSMKSGTQNPCRWLRSVVERNRSNMAAGMYSVCSANAWVLEATMRQALKSESVLCIESTSNQVNQFGGYTGMMAAQFVRFVESIALRAGFPVQNILLGSDHLGPYPWRKEPAESAIRKACELARSCVTAGYFKIHLDASMACGDDAPNQPLSDEVIAQRAAAMCQAAEAAHRELPDGSPELLYIVGTEVPIPGGEQEPGAAPAVTRVEDARQTLDSFHAAFRERGLSAAWDRVIGLVVQPGVEFGDASVFEYDRKKADILSRCLPPSPALVYEAHSTDYQPPLALRQMVEDHFAILKVGPWLTFAFREAVFALSAIEREWLGHRSGVRLSQVREALDAAMLRNPSYWRSYYRGSQDEMRLSRMYSYSDRCRYYWGDAAVQQELARLQYNLTAFPAPLTLVSQYLPLQYELIRSGGLWASAEVMIREHIRRVLRAYASACRVNEKL